MQQFFYIIIAIVPLALTASIILLWIEWRKASRGKELLRKNEKEVEALKMSINNLEKQKVGLEAVAGKCSQELLKTKNDLDRLLKLTVDRELRMAELKKEIKI